MTQLEWIIDELISSNREGSIEKLSGCKFKFVSASRIIQMTPLISAENIRKYINNEIEYLNNRGFNFTKIYENARTT